MNFHGKWLVAWVVALVSVVYGSSPSYGSHVPTPKETNAVPSIREPAVAGLFYPKQKAELSKLLATQLEAAPKQEVGKLKALICPHAGYAFSGPIAAQAYKLLATRQYETVVVLAPSHYALFKGASVGMASVYRTPLGDVPVSPKAGQLAKLPPFAPEPRCVVQRPTWHTQSSKPAPPEGLDTPDTWEHSLEVQLPFLQTTLKKFSLVPVVVGEAEPAQMARVLADLIDDQTLVVVSSDLSHYHPYEKAQAADKRCVNSIVDLDVYEMAGQEACGKAPILTLMQLARLKGWEPKLLDYRNSGDTAGDKSGVVGYAAIAFELPEPKADKNEYPPAVRKQLLELARNTLKAVLQQEHPPELETNSLPKSLLVKKGCFVTLNKRGELRGCIGHILPQEPLYQAIIDNAASAALRDPRFPPVLFDELAQIKIEISVLTKPTPLHFSSPEDLLRKLVPGRDGVVLKLPKGGATYLPQVWEQIPDQEKFLDSLAEKAGLAAGAWREPDAEVLVYHVEAFKEGK